MARTKVLTLRKKRQGSTYDIKVPTRAPYKFKNVLKSPAMKPTRHVKIASVPLKTKLQL